MYAVIATGGKQYRVEKNGTLRVELLDAAPGSTVTFDEVLLVADGANIKVGISADQIAAARLGDRTRLASLEIGADASKMAGGCDSGYSCVYSSTMSWKSAIPSTLRELSRSAAP